MAPNGTRTLQLRQLTEFITSGSRGWAEYYSTVGSRFLRIGNLRRSSIFLDFADSVFVAPPDSAEGRRTRVAPGDILVSVTADLGIVGYVDESIGEAYVNQHIALVRLDETRVNPEWAARVLASQFGQEQFRRLADHGAKAGLNLDNVMSLLLPDVTRKQQDHSVKVLRSVDDAIEATRAVIDQTRQIKTALLQDLLTSGLPGHHCEFTDDPFYGKIPASWRVVRLTEVAEVIDCKHRTPVYEKSGFPVIRPGDVREGRLDLSNCPRTSKREFDDLIENYGPKRGDIVYSRNASFGVAAYAETDQPFTIGQDVVIIASDICNTKYLFYVLNSSVFKLQLNRLSAGSTFQRINLEDIRKYAIAVPSTEEQDKISEVLWTLDQCILDEIDHMTQLQSLKTGLAQGLLTGSISVKSGAEK